MDATFAGLSLETMPTRVMSPRPATERLVERALALIDGPALVADVGTGSGAIAVALAVGAEQAEVWATDVSDDALELARRNARLHGVDDRVRVRRGDLLQPVPRGLDLVLANLPYLPDDLRDHPDYAEYGAEPARAIFAPADGLVHYRRLVEAAEEWLAPDGVLLIQLHREVLESSRGELYGLELVAA